MLLEAFLGGRAVRARARSSRPRPRLPRWLSLLDSRRARRGGVASGACQLAARALGNVAHSAAGSAAAWPVAGRAPPCERSKPPARSPHCHARISKRPQLESKFLELHAKASDVGRIDGAMAEAMMVSVLQNVGNHLRAFREHHGRRSEPRTDRQRIYIHVFEVSFRVMNYCRRSSWPRG